MKVTKTTTGRFIKDQEIFAVELKDENITAVFFNYGLILQKLIITRSDGSEQDIVLGFDTIDGYLDPAYLSNYPYFGAVIGRYANRVSDAEIRLNDTIFELGKNSDSVCLHGGFEGFDKKVWEIMALNEHEVVFRYLSPDGEEGFPGNLETIVKITLNSDDGLKMNFSASADADTAVNLTHHSYFNLNPEGGSIADHIHFIPASSYMEQDNTYAATGKCISVNQTSYDFTSPKSIGMNWEEGEGYDQSYVLDKTPGALTIASETRHDGSGTRLQIKSTAPVAHFYTAKYLGVKNGKSNRDYAAFDAFCVETQDHSNGINLSHFSTGLLKKGETHTQTVCYKVFAEG